MTHRPAAAGATLGTRHKPDRPARRVDCVLLLNLMPMAKPSRFFGTSVRRLEDPRLLRGQATFIEDLSLPGLLHVAFVRSQLAHGRLTEVDLGPALALPGVVAAIDARDVAR